MVGKDRERIEVREGEVIRFAPGEFERGVNDSDERVVSLIFSAPGAAHDNEELEYFFECRNCGEERSHHVEPVESGSWQAEAVDWRSTCMDCGNSFTTDSFG